MGRKPFYAALRLTLFSSPQPAVRMEISNNLNSVKLSPVQTGFSVSELQLQYNHSPTCELACTPNCVLRKSCCGYRLLIAAHLPVVSSSWGLIADGSPQIFPSASEILTKSQFHSLVSSTEVGGFNCRGAQDGFLNQSVQSKHR